jgi:NAD(P)-dependent dehydrogenase (short-subunit alcohol dehydrogenase family)
MERLAGKVAIVTGAGHGIGAGIARMFCAEGAAVVLADIDTEAIEGVAETIRQSGGRARAVTTDVCSSSDLRQTVDRTLDEFSALDILVNNAGLTTFGYSIDDSQIEEQYDRLMATNLKSVWMSLHFATPHLKARGSGSVINIASVHAIASSDRNSAYAASKGAIIAGTRGLAVELAPFRIRVNCISPGSISTFDPSNWLKPRLGPELYKEYEERFAPLRSALRLSEQPLPVEGVPDDIAYCAVYLASDESRFCTGANFVIDGGSAALLSKPGVLSEEAIELSHQRKEMYAWVRRMIETRESA